MFATVTALRRWPSFLRPFVHRFLPESRDLREQVKLARHLTKKILEIRIQKREQALAKGHTPIKPNDTITWMEEATAGRPVDHAAVQLAFAIGALHTTSEAFRMTLLEICVHQDLLQPLRHEIRGAIDESGWTIAGLFKMQLLDSVMKESQRMKAAAAGIERLAIRSTTMPDGTILPRGTKIAVDSSDMWSSDVHENPEAFDGYRFLRMRMSGGKQSTTASFTSSHKEHNVFGIGRGLCPGRFFASNQVKIALAHVLLEYDVRLCDGKIPKTSRVGFFLMTDPNVKVEIRRRDEDLD